MQKIRFSRASFRKMSTQCRAFNPIFNIFPAEFDQQVDRLLPILGAKVENLFNPNKRGGEERRETQLVSFFFCVLKCFSLD